MRRVPITAAAEIPLCALAGLVLGIIGDGVAGMIVGAILGAGVGALLAVALLRKQHRDAEGEDLYDEELGIVGGDVGAPNLSHPPAVIGAFSASSLGGSAGVSDEPPAEGPAPVGDA